MNKGYIPVWRKLLDREWYDDIPTKVLWLHLLLTVNIKQKKRKGRTIKPGQIITGRKKLAKQTHLSEQQIRRALHNLKTTNEITIKTTNKYSLITVCRWEDYKTNKYKQPTKQPTKNQQTTTTKEYIKKEKNIKEKYNVQKFEIFWKTYPRREGKAKAIERYKQQLKHTTHDVLLDSALLYAQECKNKEKKYIKMAEGRLNSQRRMDYLDQEPDDLFETMVYPNGRISDKEGAKKFIDKFGEDTYNKLKKQYDDKMFTSLQKN